MLKSIFISLACLDYDDELESTILSAMMGASEETNITFGVVCVSNFDFYKKTLERFKNFNNVSIKYIEISEHFGISEHRRVAASLYSGEDYFFQVDSHTYFKRNWDKYLIEKYEYSKNFLKNKKVILSGYAGAYSYEITKEGIKVVNIFDDFLGYTKWKKDEFKVLGRYIPAWEHCPIEECSEDIKEKLKKDSIVSIDKISANFLFGDKDLYTFLKKDLRFLFWEEEIVQSIELISDGFNIIYPGEYSPTLHLYSQHIKNGLGSRSNSYEFLLQHGYSIDMIENTIKENFLKYVDQNPDNVLLYTQYSGISVVSTTN